MQKRILLSALDVLLECVIYQHELERQLHWLKKISTSLDNFFETDEFSKVLENISEYKKSIAEQDENLFINSPYLPSVIKSENIFDYIDKLMIYIAIIGWIKDYSISSDHLHHKIGHNLLISEADIHLVEIYYMSDDATHHDNLMILTSEKVRADEILEGAWIDDNVPEGNEQHLHQKMEESLKVAYFKSIDRFLISCLSKKSIIKKNGRISATTWELIKVGEEVLVNDCATISYGDLKKRYIISRYQEKVSIKSWKATTVYPNGTSIGEITVNLSTGQLVGIIGREGSGKSTILKLLAGKLNTHRGKITINGYDLKKNKYQLKGIIGYVPEEDLLFDELTVFENLYLTAKLCLGNISKTEINKRVHELLLNLDLNSIRNQKVGGFQDKFIQPGQRRLLNIALELIRDPDILFIDNSVAPLSMTDSARIIDILNRYTFEGKLIITTITLVAESKFQHFNELIVLDQGGLPVFSGSSEITFQYISQWFPQGVWLKYQHEPITAEVYLNLINETTVKNDIPVRICTPHFLNTRYKEFSINNVDNKESKKTIPANLSIPPTLDKQYLIYNFRNFKAKFARKRDLIFTFTSALLIALLLSLILRGEFGGNYQFAANKNIPSYFFISIILSLFFGLTQASNEILKEKNLLNREQFLNLSRFSYINSKITYLFIIILLQTFFYVFIGNFILGIKQLLFSQWLLFASTAAFGVLLGLNFSLSFKSLEGIYSKAIPVTIILQLVLSGGVIRTDDLFKTKKPYTPLVSDLMVCKWAYEGVMVEQFRMNSYNRIFYNLNKTISQTTFVINHQLPAIESQIILCRDYSKIYPDSTNQIMNSIRDNFQKMSEKQDIFPFEYIDFLKPEEFNQYYATQALEYLEYLDIQYFKEYEKSLQRKQHLMDSLNSVNHSRFINQLRERNYNYAVSDLVLNRASTDIMAYNGIQEFQTTDPIYQTPQHNLGRTMMFFSKKMFGGRIIDTLEFNLSIIWLMNLVLYLLLISDAINNFRRFITRLN